ncbi:MAG: TIGR00730 family Rossman fold protein [Bacteroidota bacterium]
MLKSICVFCGASAGKREVYEVKARKLGELLAKNNITLVYGGGKVGLMGAVANSVLDAGGKAIGVIPSHLMDLEVGHTDLTALHVVKSMHERKQLMCDLSDGFIAMPGGFGTLDELCEILTWNQLGTIQKPAILFNVEGYFDHFIRSLDHFEEEGFLKPQNRALLMVEAEETRLFDRMAAYQPSYTHKWITSSER